MDIRSKREGGGEVRETSLKSKYIKIESILNNFSMEIRKLEVRAVEDIIGELKNETQTYKQVNEELELLQKHAVYERNEKYTQIFSEVKKTLEEEKNDLPLTNRYKKIIDGNLIEAEIFPLENEKAAPKIPVQEQPRDITINLSNCESPIEILDRVKKILHQSGQNQ